MKPRLESAPWTDEDSEILGRIISQRQYLDCCRTRGSYVHADRRDADLMFEARYARSTRAAAAWGDRPEQVSRPLYKGMVNGDPIALGGQL